MRNTNLLVKLPPLRSVATPCLLRCHCMDKLYFLGKQKIFPNAYCLKTGHDCFHFLLIYQLPTILPYTNVPARFLCVRMCVCVCVCVCVCARAYSNNYDSSIQAVMHIIQYCAAERCCVLISTAFCSIGPMFDSLPEVRLLWHLEFVVFKVLPNKRWTLSQVANAFTANALQVCCHALALYRPVQVITNEAVS